MLAWMIAVVVAIGVVWSFAVMLKVLPVFSAGGPQPAISRPAE